MMANSDLMSTSDFFWTTCVHLNLNVTYIRYLLLHWLTLRETTSNANMGLATDPENVNSFVFFVCMFVSVTTMYFLHAQKHTTLACAHWFELCSPITQFLGSTCVYVIRSIIFTIKKTHD